MAAGKILWWALVGLYDEALMLLRGNLTWFFFTFLIGLPVLLVMPAVMPAGSTEPEAGGYLLPVTLAGLLLLIVPNPASLGMHGLAAKMQRREVPQWADFWRGLRGHFGLGLALYLIGLLGIVVFGVNSVFYLRYQQGPLQMLSVVFLYLLLFWLGLQLYLGPLVMLLEERRPLALYRRAALLVLGQPFYTLVLLVATVLVMPVAVFAVPLYPCASMAFVALATTRTLGQFKQRYDPDPDEEPA